MTSLLFTDEESKASSVLAVLRIRVDDRRLESYGSFGLF